MADHLTEHEPPRFTSLDDRCAPWWLAILRAAGYRLSAVPRHQRGAVSKALKDAAIQVLE